MCHLSRPKGSNISFSLSWNTSASPTCVIQGQVTAAQNEDLNGQHFLKFVFACIIVTRWLKKKKKKPPGQLHDYKTKSSPTVQHKSGQTSGNPTGAAWSNALGPKLCPWPTNPLPNTFYFALKYNFLSVVWDDLFSLNDRIFVANK